MQIVSEPTTGQVVSQLYSKQSRLSIGHWGILKYELEDSKQTSEEHTS